VTLLDVAALFGDVDPGMIEAIADIITLVNSIPDVAAGQTLILPFGDVVLIGSGGGGGSDFNLFDDHSMDQVRDPNTPLSGLGHFGDAIGGFGNLDSALNSPDAGSLPDPVKNFTSDLGSGNFGDFIDSDLQGSLADPGRAFWPSVHARHPRSARIHVRLQLQPVLPIIGPLGASITGTLGAKFDFAFGYDSFGLQKFAEGGFQHPLDIFRGFYISDTDHADGSGSDVNEIEIFGSLVGSASSISASPRAASAAA